jgi:hypothetical protein
MTTNETNITLFGGKLITVTFEPTEAELQTSDFTLRTSEVRVRQIPIREYERGFQLVQDEIALAGFLVAAPRQSAADPCNCSRAWALTLTPQSYELVLATGREVNEKGFFAFARRRAAEQAEKEQAAMAVGLQIAREHPDLLEAAMNLGAPARPGISPFKEPLLASPPRPAA